MPQMSPMNWSMLYIFMIFMLLSIVVFNYFTFMCHKKKMYTPMNKKLNWKW